MKRRTFLFGIALLAMGISAPSLFSQEGSSVKPETIGVYDSRAVAYAYFWTPDQQKKLQALTAAAKASQDSGDTAAFQTQKKSLQDLQKQLHRQVFGTEPIDGILATLKTRLPDIQKKAGVSRILSKWDTNSLAPLKGAPQVDVTDLLVQEFKPGSKQLRMIEDIKSKKPLPLDQCED